MTHCVTPAIFQIVLWSSAFWSGLKSLTCASLPEGCTKTGLSQSGHLDGTIRMVPLKILARQVTIFGKTLGRGQHLVPPLPG